MPKKKKKTKRLKQPDSIRYAPHDLRFEVLERDGYKCRHCRTEVTMQSANIDHVIPWKKGGPTTLQNLVSSCARCNRFKGNKDNIKALPIRPHRKPTHRRVDCQKPNCHMHHDDLQSKMAWPVEVYVPVLSYEERVAQVPEFLRDAIGTECSHRASPECMRQRCLQARSI